MNDPFAHIPIYATALKPPVKCGQWRWDLAAKLFVAPGLDPALALRALHDAASSLGLTRADFQTGRADFPHYTLDGERHLRAIRVGIAAGVTTHFALSTAEAWQVAIAAGHYAPNATPAAAA